MTASQEPTQDASAPSIARRSQLAAENRSINIAGTS
jgi:hypothetical protein